MTYIRAAVAALLSFAPAAYALSPDTSKRLEGALASSSMAATTMPEAPEVPVADDVSTRDALTARTVFRAALELTGVCRNQQLRAPGWCTKPEQATVAPDGGLTVTVQDDVELELTVPLIWAVGRHAFMIVSQESLDRPDLKPAFGTVVDFGVPGIQQFRFRADRPGDYVFYEPYGRVVTGRFTVRP